MCMTTITPMITGMTMPMITGQRPIIPKPAHTTGTTMLDDFLVRAGLAGIGLSLATGPLGAFVVWRRMAYFGDATAHAAILGVALALATDLPVGLGTLAVALIMAVTVATLAARGWAMDTTLGVLAHSALAFGLVAISFVHGVRTDLSAWLFGDILAVTRGDLAFIWGGALLVALLLIWRWSALLTATLNEDLAHASGLNPDRERLVLVLALAVVVAVALKVVGALLIAAMLIIPAAAARGMTRSPESMALVAVVIGVAASIGGLGLSLWQDTPAGPSIVACAAVVFALSAIVGPLRRR
jgi:zinc transport system permease protein